MPLSKALSWIDFWNRENSIYANARHKKLHDRLVVDGIVSFVPSEESVVLDYGCGDTTEAATVAQTCKRLYLFDPAKNIEASIRSRYAKNARIIVLSDAELWSFPQHSIDLIVINSVVQYVAREDLASLFVRLRTLLTNDGLLVVGDVIPRNLSRVADATALLRFGLKGGFFFAAFGGLIRTALSDYRHLTADLGLATYDESEMLDQLASSGYRAARHLPNIGHNGRRMTFTARPAG